LSRHKFFSGFVEKSFDFESQEPKEITLSLKGPSHINICFDEPLIDQPVMPWAADARESAVTHKAPSLQAQKQNFEQALIVVGSLNSQERSIALNWLPSTGAPVFAEASSGLRSSEFYQKQGLWGGEKIVSKLLTSGEVKNVIRLGDVPLGRYWRDLDQRGIPVFSYSTKNGRGLSVGSIESGQWDQNSFSQIQVKHWAWQHWLELGLQKRHSLHQLIDRYPESEIAFFRDLAQSLSFDDSLYLGNSLPVRLWDLVCESGSHDSLQSRGQWYRRPVVDSLGVERAQPQPLGGSRRSHEPLRYECPVGDVLFVRKKYQSELGGE
jgi:2-succinyl-5-enolpyruvyl-6-hydroxy-3-cyclohexene-1-carboxylate synthase